MTKQKNNTSNLKVKIISGLWRGRNISFLEKKDLRPTKIQVRETLFNWLQNDIKDSVCVDLFAGSGALGFEAASRGAKKVFMVDNDVDIINCLEEQKKVLNANNVDIIHASADIFLTEFQDKVDIIFLDPPFSQNIIKDISLKLSELRKISKKCKIYVELPYCIDFEKSINVPYDWELLKSNKSGEVAFLLYQC